MNTTTFLRYYNYKNWAFIALLYTHTPVRGGLLGSYGKLASLLYKAQ